MKNVLADWTISQLEEYLTQTQKLSTKQMLAKRYRKYRSIGEYDHFNR